MIPNRNNDVEERMQSAAECADLPDGLPVADVAAYRMVYRAIRDAQLPLPPHSFASRMESLTRDHPEQAAVEIWTLRLFAVLLGAAAVGLAPTLAKLAFTVAGSSPGLPWPLLLAGAAALAVAAGVDWIARARPGPDS